MVKITLIRLPDWAGEEIEKIVAKKGLPFATVTRGMVCEHLNECASVTAAKHVTDAADDPVKKGPSCQ